MTSGTADPNEIGNEAAPRPRTFMDL